MGGVRRGGERRAGAAGPGERLRERMAGRGRGKKKKGALVSTHMRAPQSTPFQHAPGAWNLECMRRECACECHVLLLAGRRNKRE